MEEITRVTIRKSNHGDDHAFIFSTWRNALWYAEKRDEREAERFFRETSRRIALLVRAGDVRIACEDGNPDQLFGWAVLIGEHLEFVYVKADYRKQGIARLLTRGFKSHGEPETRIGRKIAERLKQENAHGRKEEASSAQSPEVQA